MAEFAYPIPQGFLEKKTDNDDFYRWTEHKDSSAPDYYLGYVRIYPL